MFVRRQWPYRTHFEHGVSASNQKTLSAISAAVFYQGIRPDDVRGLLDCSEELRPELRSVLFDLLFDTGQR